MCSRQSVPDAFLVVAKPSGAVDVLLTAQRVEPPYGTYYPVATNQTLVDFLTDPAFKVAAGTPIARLDCVDFELTCDFQSYGPIPAGHLPVGTVRPVRGGDRVFHGERWDTIGAFTLVSVDVYLSLVCQVGGTVSVSPQGSPAAPTGLDAGAINPHSREGLAILDLFARVKSVELDDGDHSWPGGDVVEQLLEWLPTVGIHPEEDPDLLIARLRGHHPMQTPRPS